MPHSVLKYDICQFLLHKEPDRKAGVLLKFWISCCYSFPDAIIRKLEVIVFISSGHYELPPGTCEMRNTRGGVEHSAV